MYRFKLRHILFAILGLLVTLTLIQAFSFGAMAINESRSAQRHLAADALSNALLHSNIRIAQERGQTAIALMTPGQAGAETLAELQSLREENDRRLGTALSAAEQFSHLVSSERVDTSLQQLRERIDGLHQARRQADQRLLQPQTGGAEPFIKASTALIEALAALRYLSQTPDIENSAENPIFHETLHTLTEMVGRERALLGGAIAAQRPLSENELESLWAVRGILKGGWGKFTQATQQYAGEAEVDAAREKLEQHLQNRFAPLREAVFLAARQRAPYPVDAATWYREATAAIDVYLAYGATINRVIASELQRQQKAAARVNYLVIGATALIMLIVVGVILLGRLRFVLPLRQLEQAALTIGRGDLSRPLRMRGNDELTQFGNAFETMRTGLNEQQQQRRQAEARLKASILRFRTLVEGLDEIIWEIDEQGRYTYLSPQLETILGYAPEEWLGGEFMALTSVAECAWLHDGPGGAGERHQPCQAVAHITHHKNGHKVFLESSAAPVFDEQGSFRGYRGITRDISWRREAEVEKQRLLQILDQSGDLILIANREGIIEYVNSGFEQATGYRPDEVIGQHTRLLKSGIHSDAFYRELWRTIRAGEPFQASMIDRRKDGELLHIEQTITPLHDADGRITHFASTAKDVTAQRQIDEQMQQSEKLASLGMLAAGVAHEINNPIGYIRANLNTLEKYVAELLPLLDRDGTERPPQRPQPSIDPGYLRHDIGELLQETREGVERVRNIVTDLKKLSHPAGEDAWQLVDLHQELNSTLNIARSEFKHKAEVVCQFGELPPVQCLPGQLNQVFLNLLVNAAQAIERGGVIVIRTGQRGEEAWIEVSDTGKGISPQHLKRLFEPFFTTKPAGEGTGIGLSLSHRIVEKHHGRIEVDSEEGVGSRFRVWLPLRQGVSAGEQTA